VLTVAQDETNRVSISLLTRKIRIQGGHSFTNPGGMSVLVRATWRAHELAALFEASTLASAASGVHW
jgi:hypothetical protein